MMAQSGASSGANGGESRTMDPCVGDVVRVLFEDGWESGSITRVGDAEEKTASITRIWVTFEEDTDPEEYAWPDPDICLLREQSALFGLVRDDGGGQDAGEAIAKMLASRPALAKSVEVDGVDETPVAYLAVMLNKPAVLRALLKAGANPDLTLRGGDRLLHAACDQAHAGCVSALVDAKAAINAHNAIGWTPLHVAAANGDTKLYVALRSSFVRACRAMQAARKRWNALDQSTRHRLGWSRIKGNQKGTGRPRQASRLALAALGAPLLRPSIRQRAQMSQSAGAKIQKPLTLDDVRSAHPRAVLEIDAKTDVKLGKKKARSPLHFAARHGKGDFVRVLARTGADLELQDADQRTPLHLACMHGRTGAVNALVEAKASLHARDKKGYTPLVLAALMGAHGVVDALLASRRPEWWILINSRDHDGMTALNHAAKRGDTKMVDTLLRAKAYPCTQEVAGLTPLHWCVLRGQMGLAKMLLKHEEKLDISACVYWYHVVQPLGARFFDAPDWRKPAVPRRGAKFGDFVRAVQVKNSWAKLDNGLWVPVWLRDSETEAGPLPPPAPVASSGDAKQGSTFVDDRRTVLEPFMHELLPKKWQSETTVALSSNTDIADISGRTGLHIAAQMGNQDMAKLLIDAKAQCNIRDKDGLTPLYLAANSGHANLAKLLLKSNADPRIPREDGWTPLHIAAAFDREECVTVLLRGGADAKAKDRYGVPPEGVTKNEAVRKLLSGSV